MLLPLDTAILRMVAVPVRLWYKTTGKSNFQLAKVLVYFSALIYAAWPIQYLLEGSNALAMVSGFFFALVVAALFMTVIPQLRKAEKALERWEGGALPLEVFYYHRARTVLTRMFFMSGSAVLFAVIAPTDGEPAVGIAVAGYLFLMALHYYVAACVTPKRHEQGQTTPETNQVLPPQAEDGPAADPGMTQSALRPSFFP